MKPIYQENHRFRFYKGFKPVNFPPHLHGAVEVFYFLEGETLAQCGTQKYRLGAGDLFIAFPNQIHGYEDSKNAYVFNMIIYPKPWLMPYYKLLTEKLPVLDGAAALVPVYAAIIDNVIITFFICSYFFTINQLILFVF